MSIREFITNGQVDRSTDKLAKLIGQKHEILVQIHGLLERQAQLVQESDMTRLLSLLAAKQRFIDQLQAVETKLNPFRNEDPEERQWSSAEFRQRVRSIAESNEQLLEKIVEQERSCESLLRQRRDDAAVRLQGMHDATAARAAYVNLGASHPQQIDLSSES